MFFELHPALLANLPSRAAQKQTALNELQPDLFLPLHVYALYFALGQLADIDQVVVVLSGREGMLRPTFLDLLSFHIQEADHIIAVAFVLHNNASVGGLEFYERDLVVIFGEGLE